MLCENCKKEHDGSYGSGRFCSEKCARGFSTKAKRKEINKKVSKKLQKPENFNYCDCGVKLSHSNKSGFCISCKPLAKSRSEIISNFRRKRKKDLVEYKGGRCEKCGYDKSVWSLHFHHLNSNEKEFNLSKNGNCRSLEKDKKEVDKCILVCSNCHGEIHEKLYIAVVANQHSV